MSEGRIDGFLAAAFRDFFNHLAELREVVEGDPWRYSKRTTESEPDKADTSVQAVATVRHQLRQFLQHQSMDAVRRMGEDGSTRLARAQYVMASLADEVFVNMEWEGRERWTHDLLETHLFHSHVAGERIFEFAETLLREGEDGDVELAQIYLAALCLGFQGRYRGMADPRPLQDIRRRLTSFVEGGRPSLAGTDGHLFPQALEHTLVSAEPLRLPPVQRWAMILVAMLTVYLVVGHVVWNQVSSDLREVNERMDETRARGGRTS